MKMNSLGNPDSLVAVLMLMINFPGGTWCLCPGSPDRSVLYTPVSELDYDRNYSSITSEGKQPLGFQKAIWPFNQPDSTPCIRVTGARYRRLEIMFETFPSSRLCMKLTGAQMECSDAGTGRLYACPRATADTLYIEFTCDSQCAEVDVQFWYRLVLGVTPDEDPEDHWCDHRNREEYPESLRQLPSDFPINTQTEKPSGGTCQHLVSFTLMFVIILLIF